MEDKKIPDSILQKANQYLDAKPLNVTIREPLGEVVGEEVDENNDLIYVLRKDKVISMIYAFQVRVFVNSLPFLGGQRTIKRIF